MAAVVSTMRIRSIPKHLLIHSIEYKELESNDGWGDTEKEPITIDFVRVETSKMFSRSGDSIGTDSKLVVFVDRENSSSMPEFKSNSTITWQGKDYELSEVKPFYDIDPTNPHHYELGLR